MNNIDILEEFIKINFLYGKISFTDEQFKKYQQAILNLIAENKELKEKNDNLNWYFENQKDNFIPKSKVEETIQTMNTNILNAEKFDCDYIGQCRFAKYILQSLLGKE